MLERADIGADQVMETKQSSERNSRSGEGEHQNWSGPETKQGSKGTHLLERADARAGQEMETK